MAMSAPVPLCSASVGTSRLATTRSLRTRSSHDRVSALIKRSHVPGTLISVQGRELVSLPEGGHDRVSALIKRSHVPGTLISVQGRELVSLPEGGTFSVAFGSQIQRNIAASSFGNVTALSDDTHDEWTKKDNRRMLHVVYRVVDLDKAIKFYTECFGMKVLRKRNVPHDGYTTALIGYEDYTTAFLGYGNEDTHFVVELVSLYRVEWLENDIGTGFGHFGLAVEDVQKVVNLVISKGGVVIREPAYAKSDPSITAVVADPDGYRFEVIQRPPTPEPVCQVMLKVGDLERAILFYKKALGMQLLDLGEYPEYNYSIATMGYGPEYKNCVLKLTYHYGVSKYRKGNRYALIAIGTDNVYKTTFAVKHFGGKIVLEPGLMPVMNTRITAALDPDGWTYVFVHNGDFTKDVETYLV